MEKIFSVTQGTGPPMVLVHGWTCDHGTMEPVAEAFPDFECHLVDLLGHGRSPKSPDYAIERQAEAVLKVAPERAIWIGHSMGAQVALAAAAAAPERVKGVVLLDPARIAPHEKAVAFMEGIRAQLTRVDIPAMIEAFGRNQIVRARNPERVERMIATMRSTDPDVTRTAWDAIMAWDGAATIAVVRCPILLIAIDKALNRLSDVARLNKKAMTGQVVGSGHMVQYEVMDQVELMIRRFLEINDLLIHG